MKVIKKSSHCERMACKSQLLLPNHISINSLTTLFEAFTFLYWLNARERGELCLITLINYRSGDNNNRENEKTAT